MKILNIKSNLSQTISMYKNTDLYLRHVAEKKIDITLVSFGIK